MPHPPASAQLGRATTLFASPGGGPKAAHACGQRAGPAFPGARAGLRPGPSPRRGARARPRNALSLRLRGREEGGGSPRAAPLPHPQRRPQPCPHPGPNREQQVFLGRLGRPRGWGLGLPGSAAGDGRRTHRAPAGGPRQVFAPPGRKTPRRRRRSPGTRRQAAVAAAAAAEPEERERRTAASARARTGR